MSYCEKHKREKVLKEKTGYGFRYSCPDCNREWYEEYDRRKGTESD